MKKDFIDAIISNGVFFFSVETCRATFTGSSVGYTIYYFANPAFEHKFSIEESSIDNKEKLQRKSTRERGLLETMSLNRERVILSRS